jgi:hypothetical protein
MLRVRLYFFFRNHTVDDFERSLQRSGFKRVKTETGRVWFRDGVSVNINVEKK